jgi:hypothetical protein
VSGKYLRGAFVEFMPTFLVPLPNVVIFQYNPETMTHTWTPPASATDQSDGRSNPLAVRGPPEETFSFSLSMDAGDMIADGSVVAEGIATVSGIYTRLAALEMLQYPVSSSGGGLMGSVTASISIGGSGIGGSASGSAGANRSVPQSSVPTVLFVWGPGRIVPVRVTGLTITEKLYDGLLNPTHADATVSLRVLTLQELQFVTGPLKEIARGAYTYSQALRQALALANLANSAESVIGMLPI